MKEQTITFSIVTYNNEIYIEKLLDSIIEFVHGVDYHIYVIDNCSTDKTIQLVRKRLGPSIDLILRSHNKGFGSGHNTILDKIDSKYHVCVNPDIVLDDDVITKMARYMDEHEDIGLLAPKILNPDGTVQVLPKRNPRLIYLISRRINFQFLSKYRREYEMQERDDNLPFDIEFCSGCFMFLRTALFKDLGGFDERYFMYFEDADLTRRVRQHARAEYNPSFRVYHIWARAGRRQLKYFIIQVVSMIKYMVKWRRLERS